MAAGRTAGVTVRAAEARDGERMRALLGQLGYPMEKAELEARIAPVSSKPCHLLVVAEDADGRVVGLLHAFERPSLEKPPEVTIQAMVVDEACRSQGIGAALMRSVEDWARARGFDTLGLHTQLRRQRARAFYERQGFEEVARSALYRRRLAK